MSESRQNDYKRKRVQMTYGVKDIQTDRMPVLRFRMNHIGEEVGQVPELRATVQTSLILLDRSERF